MKDSATYMPAGSVRFEEDDGNGNFELVVDSRTSACLSYDLCPAINTTFIFTKDDSKLSGYRFGFDGNTSPSIAIKKLKSDNTWGIEQVWNEPPGKGAIDFLIGLIDILSNLKENVPPPDNPNQCTVS